METTNESGWLQTWGSRDRLLEVLTACTSQDRIRRAEIWEWWAEPGCVRIRFCDGHTKRQGEAKP